MTRRLYYEDAYQKTFFARVVCCEPASDGGFYIRLDQTAFFPGGGGQPCDLGKIGEARVLEVGEDDGEIWHKTDLPYEVGTELPCEIDWDRRFDLMQQHSGEHIVSGIAHEKYGCENVGFHMGEEWITVDLNQELTPEQVRVIEREANDYVWKDLPSKVFLPTETERKTLPYRSKKELTGEVRLIEFPGADLCACCGTHVTSAGQIGLIKLASAKRFRGGTRIEMVSGKRAFRYLLANEQQNRRIAVSLSVKPEETADALGRLQDEIYAMKGEISHLKQQRLLEQAGAYAGRGNLCLLVEGLDAVGLRKYADAILSVCGGICCVLSESEGSFRYAIGTRDGDIRGLVKEMNQALAGRGGGKPFFAQGSLTAGTAQIRAFFEERGFDCGFSS